MLESAGTYPFAKMRLVRDGRERGRSSRLCVSDAEANVSGGSKATHMESATPLMWSSIEGATGGRPARSKLRLLQGEAAATLRHTKVTGSSPPKILIHGQVADTRNHEEDT